MISYNALLYAIKHLHFVSKKFLNSSFCSQILFEGKTGPCGKTPSFEHIANLYRGLSPPSLMS